MTQLDGVPDRLRFLALDDRHARFTLSVLSLPLPLPCSSLPPPLLFDKTDAGLIGTVIIIAITMAV